MGRIHLVGLPHTQFDDVNFSFCAFTAKAVRLARMLRAAGREVVVYWGGDMADVSLLSVEEQQKYFGTWEPNQLPSIEWNGKLPYWQQFHVRALGAINDRLDGDDIIGFIGGSISYELIDRFKQTHTVIEPGVGYEGIHLDTFACYESYAWMHNRYGAYNIGDGRAFDTVIPNAVVPDEWEMSESKGYALFVGRLISRKGPHAAARIANESGLKLLLAGGGVASQEPGRIVATDGTIIEGDVEHVGAVVGDARRKLFAGAEVFICPTLYIGPWEGVHAEAMMSGVGVAAPDYGVFTETLPEVNRYRSLRQALVSVENARATRGEEWRQRAIDICGTEVCTAKYDKWIDQLESLRGGRLGWYDLSPSR